MRILIVNDDGINAPGLTVAEEIAAEVGGAGAEIWVVAPAVEKSGASHCVSYTVPMRVIEMGERRFAIEGYPADCAIAGICDLMPERPDLLLSGVNRGHNVAEDAVYSGTVAGAKEGSIQGIKSISLSQYFSAREGDLFDAAVCTAPKPCAKRWRCLGKLTPSTTSTSHPASHLKPKALSWPPKARVAVRSALKRRCPPTIASTYGSPIPAAIWAMQGQTQTARFAQKVGLR